MGVIKCYKLVFNIKDKFQNIGFWIFSILIIFHIPILIHYSIYNIISIKKYIFSEINRSHYWIPILNPIKNSRNERFSTLVELKVKKRKNKNKINKYFNINNNKGKLSEDAQSSNSLSKKLMKSNKRNSNSKKIKNLNLKNKNKEKKIKHSILLLNYTVLNKHYINTQKEKTIQNTKKNCSKINLKEKIKQNKITFSPKIYFLIQIDANNQTNIEPPNSNSILDNYEYETAIKYEKRNFFRIFYICLISKQSIINLILFKNPLNLQMLKICLFIFNYSCDLAFNTIFYSNQNISDKYHYEGDNLIYFTFVNNIVQSVTSSMVSFILINLFQYFIDSRGNFENIFRKEEKKMRKNRKYKVSKEKKSIILKKIRKTYVKLKYKIIIFLISEFFLMLFFCYFVTAFCEVYKQTQLSWLSDFFASFLISFSTEVCIALILAIFYILSLRYKLKLLYKIVLFAYNL